MSAPRLKVGGIVRDDTHDGIARLRIDQYGNLYLDAEDLAAMALMLASPPAVNKAALAAEARAESEQRLREETARREAERIAAGAAREAEVRRLREQFPSLAAELFPPADDAPAWRVFTVEGGQRQYFEKYGLGGGRFHTPDRGRAMRFGSREAAQQQTRDLGFQGQYLVEAP